MAASVAAVEATSSSSSNNSSGQGRSSAFRPVSVGQAKTSSSLSSAQETGCSEVSTTVDREEEAKADREENGEWRDDCERASRTTKFSIAAVNNADGVKTCLETKKRSSETSDDLIDVEAVEVKKEKRDPAEPQVNYQDLRISFIFTIFIVKYFNYQTVPSYENGISFSR